MFGEAQSSNKTMPNFKKALTPRKLGKVGNDTHFPHAFRCFSLESDFANDCQPGKVTLKKG
jgi:hypothetical protein